MGKAPNLRDTAMTRRGLESPCTFLGPNGARMHAELFLCPKNTEEPPVLASK